MSRTHPRLLTLSACAILLGMAALSNADTPAGYSGAAGQPYGGASAPYAPASPPGYSYSPYPSSPYAPPYPGGNFSSAPAGAYPPPPLPTRKAYVRVFLPDDRAKVTFDGQETSATGASRLFETPPLPVGQTYSYAVKATWRQNGRPVTQERRVVVVPGQYAVANFNLPAPVESLPAPNASEPRSYP
jgi:uncharacterized protein (TIGR03000 family)